MARRALPDLVKHRLARFTTDFDDLLPLKLTELAKCLKVTETNDAQYFDFAVLGVSVCFLVKCWAEGYPRSTLLRYCDAAVEGRTLTRPQIKQLSGAPAGSIRRGSIDVRAHARAYIVDEVKTAAEEQPNVQPYENVAGDVQLAAHIDPFIPCRSRCKRARSHERRDVGRDVRCDVWHGAA